MAAVAELASDVGTSAACQSLCMPRASYYRDGRKTSSPAVTASRPSPARALRPAEREVVLSRLHEERFQDRSPAAVYATLLDEGEYHCSIRTMYRLLEQRGESRERRDQLIHPSYQKPELMAAAPNQLWSWDISKLLGPAKWTYFYLYVILDVFSRYVTGWMVAYRESAELAKRLIEESCKKQRIQPGQLTLHADRGTSMRSKPVALLLADLGVTKTHSRPHVSDDNPFSESQFRTLKYRPEFPDRFGCIQDSRAFCQSFFRWYNEEHRHSGLSLLTPTMVHYGQAENVLRQRQDVLDVAYQRHPERFVRSTPKPLALPSEVWINKPVSAPEPLPVGGAEETAATTGFGVLSLWASGTTKIRERWLKRRPCRNTKRFFLGCPYIFFAALIFRQRFLCALAILAFALADMCHFLERLPRLTLFLPPKILMAESSASNCAAALTFRFSMLIERPFALRRKNLPQDADV